MHGFLKQYNHSTMIFDDAMINWKDTDFTAFNLINFYHDARQGKYASQCPLAKRESSAKNAFVDDKSCKKRKNLTKQR
jgi:hypothetical protein